MNRTEGMLDAPRGQVDRVLDAARAWAEADPSIRAIALVGSYARDAARPDSDVDLVVLSRAPERLLDSDAWFDRLAIDGPVLLIRCDSFGAIQERRLRLASGLEVEVGIGDLSWVSIDPLDPGTAAVARNGLRPIWDPDGALATLVATLR